MTEAPNPLDNLKRTIVLLYGLSQTNEPFWVFAAIRLNKYQAFLTMQKEGNIDLNTFSEYGELIVSGEGKSPPDDIILKVAEMYQTSAAILQKALDDNNGELK